MRLDTYRNIGMTFILIALLLTVLKDIKLGQKHYDSYFALVLIFCICLAFPFIGMLVAIPIGLLILLRADTVSAAAAFWKAIQSKDMLGNTSQGGGNGSGGGAR